MRRKPFLSVDKTFGFKKDGAVESDVLLSDELGPRAWGERGQARGLRNRP